MEFKKWLLEDIGSRQNVSGNPGGGPEYATAGLGPQGSPGGGTSDWSRQGELRTPAKKKKLPPLGFLSTKNKSPKLPPRDNLELTHL